MALVVELTFEIARIMEQFDPGFSYNADLLISGAILHDIAKADKPEKVVERKIRLS